MHHSKQVRSCVPSLALLLLVGLVLGTTTAQGGTDLYRNEIRCGFTGDVEVRSCTVPGGSQEGQPATSRYISERPAASDQAVSRTSASAQVIVEGRDGSILWYDRNHQNAVAENVAITGDGAYGIAGWWLNNKRIALYRIDQEDIPEWTRPMTAAFQIPVDADLNGEHLLATGRGDPLYVFTTASSDPVFTHAYTAPLQGYKCAVSASGNTYAGGGGNPSGGAGEVRVYDGSGVLRFIRNLPAPPEGVNVSADGQFVIANVRGFAKIWDAMTGALRDSIPIPGETQTPAVISGDGGFVVTGGFNRTVATYHWNGSDYALLWQYVIPSTTWVTALAISEDGSTLVAGTWTNPTGGKLVVFATESSTPLWTDASFGDEVPTAAVTPDGLRIAAASWGRSGVSIGNIISVYDRASVTPVYGVADDQIDGIGSAMAIDLSRDGQYVFAGGKAVHAREFGSGGWTMALQVPAPAAADPVPTRRLALSASPNPFSGAVRFNLGTGGSNADLVISDAGGRQVWSGEVPVTGGSCEWDGCDRSGRPVAPGAYFARVTAGSAGETSRVKFLRVR